jgi:hypothetical protein
MLALKGQSRAIVLVDWTDLGPFPAVAPVTRSPERAQPSVRGRAQVVDLARDVDRHEARLRTSDQRHEDEGRPLRRTQVALFSKSRGLSLPPRLRSSVALDDQARRTDPVSARRPSRIRRADPAGDRRVLSPRWYRALPGGVEASPTRPVPHDPRARRILAGHGLRASSSRSTIQAVFYRAICRGA